jgi:hypothetical protein
VNGRWYFTYHVGPFRYARALRTSRSHWMVKGLAYVVVLLALLVYATWVAIRWCCRSIYRKFAG